MGAFTELIRVVSTIASSYDEVMSEHRKAMGVAVLAVNVKQIHLAWVEIAAQHDAMTDDERLQTKPNLDAMFAELSVFPWDDAIALLDEYGYDEEAGRAEALKRGTAGAIERGGRFAPRAKGTLPHMDGIRAIANENTGNGG